MTNSLLKLKTLALFLAFSASAAAADVDLKNSKVVWLGSKVIGSTHTGEVGIKSADVKYEGKEPKSAKVVLDMTSITNTDVKNKGWNKKLVDHLKNDDFFAVDKFKTATLMVDKIVKASDKFYMLHGKLTIKDKTQDIKIKAEILSDSGSQQKVKAEFEFDRTKFGIKYGSGSFFTGLGDKMISDEVKITVELLINTNKSMAKN